MRRASPRLLAPAVTSLTERLAPATTLADIQRVWREVAGAMVAAAAEPVSERDGVLSVTCESAVWAHELTLMAPQVVERLNVAVGREAVTSLRCRTTRPAGLDEPAP